MKRMRSFFARHAVDKEAKNWGRGSPGWVAWQLWGGDAGQKWVEQELQENPMEIELFPYSLLRSYEPVLKRLLGKKYTFREPTMADGPLTLIYQWYARKNPGDIIPDKFIMTVTYVPRSDSFNVKQQLVDGYRAETVWVREFEDVYIDTIADPKWFLSGLGERDDAIQGMEGPFTYADGRTLYYDPREGRYYDRTRDEYLDRDDLPGMKRNAGKGKRVEDYDWGRAFMTAHGPIYHKKVKVGKLGLVSYDQAMRHQEAGVSTHEWRHHATYGSRKGPDYGTETEYKCAICGAKKVIAQPKSGRAYTLYR